MSAEAQLRAAVAERKAAAAGAQPLSDAELQQAVKSLQLAGGDDLDGSPDWSGLRELLSRVAHKPHKDWPRTEAAADELASLLGSPDDAAFSRIFQRVLQDGNWPSAQAAATTRSHKPWAVLVTGVNGIRKTSSVYQPWFKEVLSQALDGSGIPVDALPDGSDSYFRQLDYMIATVASQEFRRLYEVEDVGLYAAIKDGIFARYRTVAEMLGVLLVKESRAKRMNVMIETSGRDIAMFEYVDHLFPDDDYRKLVVHFSINDVSYAEASVDKRMLKEMRDGREALARSTLDVIRANAGGPYGSAVLRGVQADSDAVWERVRSGEADVAKDWLKARLAITAHESEPWTVHAARPGEAATRFAFGPPK